MEPNRKQSIDGFTRRPEAGAPVSRPHSRPMRLMNDFGPRPVTRLQPASSPVPTSPPVVPSTAPTMHMTQPARPPMRPVSPMPSQPSPRPVSTQTNPYSQPSILSPLTPEATEQVPEAVNQTTPVDNLDAEMSQNEPKQPRSKSSHTGLAGLVVFIVLMLLFVLPLLPGKTLENFPGSSVESSSGVQSFACIKDPTNLISSTSTGSKSGFPIAYKYTTTTTNKAICDGTPQSIIASSTSQFNPIGLVADTVLALVIALAFGKLWSIIYNRTHKSSR